MSDQDKPAPAGYTKQQTLQILVSAAMRDLLPPGAAPLTDAERVEFAYRLTASIRMMPDVISVEFAPDTGIITITRMSDPVVLFPMTFTVR